ncbi:MAG: hypothetical protein CMI01_15320 [Oceanospirillaceae bacterium]|nr:hypothetical protein [Oceanospirillaceae bacterium]
MPVTSSEFWDRVAAGYSKRPIADTESYARKLAATQALMHPDMQVLEFGCGTGSTALEHAPHVSHIVATDLSAKMISMKHRSTGHIAVRTVCSWSVKKLVLAKCSCETGAKITPSKARRITYTLFVRYI